MTPRTNTSCDMDGPTENQKDKTLDYSWKLLWAELQSASVPVAVPRTVTS